ncbi:MAG: E2/UBC family protein [Prolixibacteraceae bacterium]
MAKLDFLNQLQALGYVVHEPAPDFLRFEFEIPVGKFYGQWVSIALQVNDSFPLNPPPGPHLKPHLLPISGGGGTHPYGAIHTSPLGSEWQYWSRPFTNHWNNTDKTVKTYLAHIKNLFATIS